jgi:tricorn protease
MKFRRVLFVAVLFVSLTTFAQNAQPSFSTGTAPITAFEPAISPNGAEIAFVSGGDIWTVPSAGGEAHLLVAHPATESRPLYSPDGKYLAFTSARTGNGDVYVLTLMTGELNRLTYDDSPERVEAWSPDSKWIYFSNGANDISGMNDIYQVRVSGGTPMPVTADRYVNEYNAAPAPDGKSLAFVAHGMEPSQWWRNGHAHIDETEIWQVKDGASGTPKYEMLVKGGAKQLWPMWSEDGRTLYYTSDRSGTENLWAHSISGEKQLTAFRDGRLLWPSISADGRFIVFERNFGIWRYDVASGQTHPVTIQLHGVPAEPAVEHRKISDRLQAFVLSPDGKKVVFQVRGDLFAASAKDGGEGFRITNTLAEESSPVWLNDNKRIVYDSDRGGARHLYLYDFATQTETALTSGGSEDERPLVSPDGKSIVFLRDRSKLVVMDLGSKKQTEIAKVLTGPPAFGPVPYDWSPDSKWIAYLDYSGRNFRNARVVPVTGGTPQFVSVLANTAGMQLKWSGDGKFLLFITNQRTEGGKVARVDLLPRVPLFREDQFRDLFRDEKPSPTEVPTPDVKPEAKPEKSRSGNASATEAARKDVTSEAAKEKEKKVEPTKIIFEGINERLTFLPVGLDVDSSLAISPDGKTLALVATVAGHQNVYSYSLDELAKEPPVAKQLTSTPGRKSQIQFTKDGKEIFYLDDGKIAHTTLENPKPAPVVVSAEMDVDFNREKEEVFEEAWRALRDNFYDPSMKGKDWTALKAQYAPLIASSRNGDEMRRLISLMIGELNASHMGIGAPQTDAAKPSTGRLGLFFNPGEYESTGKFHITKVVDQSPAAVSGIKMGEYLVAIDGTRLTPSSNLQQLLEYKIDRRTGITVADAKGVERTVFLKPVNLSTSKNLLYRDWVNQSRAYVDRISHGKLGYVHIPDMSENSLNQLAIDLDAQNMTKQGVVIDIRNNNGGFVNAYAIDIFARRGYMTMTPRGLTASPARTVLGQRSLELPTVLVTNQHSLSDAEDFTEGYRTLALGKVVGEPTAGWIIYTGGTQLIDGSTLRLPMIRVTDHEGKDMELNPRPVDLEVENQVGESYAGVDTQLDRAVQVLLNQIEPGKLQAVKSAGSSK